MTALDRLDAIRERRLLLDRLSGFDYKVAKSILAVRDTSVMEAALRKLLLIEPRPTLAHPNGITQQERERALGYNRALADVKAIIQDFLS